MRGSFGISDRVLEKGVVVLMAQFNVTSISKVKVQMMNPQCSMDTPQRRCSTATITYTRATIGSVNLSAGIRYRARLEPYINSLPIRGPASLTSVNTVLCRKHT